MKSPFNSSAVSAFAAKPLSIAIAVVLASSSLNVIAAEALPTIQVQADFRHTDINQLPDAISVVDAEQIEARSADHLESILSFAPNVNFAGGSSRGRYFQIRGIGERSQFIDPVNPSVGLSIDGIDLTGLGGAATLFDIQQVEVLRGPQGTRFGANALAGFINITSEAPTQQPQGYLQAKVGNYGSYSKGFAYSDAVNDALSARIAINQYQSNGYIDNLHLNRDNTNNFDELVGRLKLRWQPNDDNQIDLTLLRADIDNGYDAFSLNNTRNTLSDEPGKDLQKTNALSLIWDNQISDAVTLQLSTSDSRSDVEYSFDEDWAFDGYDAAGYSYFDQYTRKLDRSNQEIRLLSGQEGRIFNDSTDWVFGINRLSRDESLSRRRTKVSSNLDSQLDVTSIALFSELSTDIGDDSRVIYGLRTERWRNAYSNDTGLNLSDSERLWGGKITLETLLGYDHLGYASLARGYKAGGFNSSPDISVDKREFNAEKNNSLEVGLKSSLLSDRLTTRLAVFYIQRKDQQVTVSESVGSPPSFPKYIENAAEGINYGLELESEWLLTETLNWQFSLGYLQTEFKDYRYQDAANVIIDNSGRDQAHAPEYSVATAINWRFLSGWSVRLESEAKDQYFFSDSHDQQSSSFVLWHANIGYEAANWKVGLYSRNLSDKEYATRGFFFENDPKVGYAKTLYTQKGAPRLFGLEGKYTF